MTIHDTLVLDHDCIVSARRSNGRIEVRVSRLGGALYTTRDGQSVVSATQQGESTEAACALVLALMGKEVTA